MQTVTQRGAPGPGFSDVRLVEACLEGHGQAWASLVDRYKNLIYAIVLEYGVPKDEAADIFQQVWVDAFNGLAKLRKKTSLKSWLITLTLNRCHRFTRSNLRAPRGGGLESERLVGERLVGERLVGERLVGEATVTPEVLEALERDQLIHEAISELGQRCQELIHLLFFSFPPKPYREVARHLGLATGSIGFTRGRCLERLRNLLIQKGFCEDRDSCALDRA